MEMGREAIRIVLASTSPRRRELLSRACARAGARFAWIDPGIEDSECAWGSGGGVSPEALCAALAHLKARAGCERLREGVGAVEGETGERVHPERAWIVGADTVCVLEGEVIGKASTECEARRMIERFMGRAHGVVTGVAILRHGAEGACEARRIFAERAVVRLGELGEGQIEEYVASGLWKGKAGAYNLVERIGAGWPLSFEGDATCVVGLPMGRVCAALGLGVGGVESGSWAWSGGAA